MVMLERILEPMPAFLMLEILREHCKIDKAVRWDAQKKSLLKTNGFPPNNVQTRRNSLKRTNTANISISWSFHFCKTEPVESDKTYLTIRALKGHTLVM